MNNSLSDNNDGVFGRMQFVAFCIALFLGQKAVLILPLRTYCTCQSFILIKADELPHGRVRQLIVYVRIIMRK